LARSLLNSAPGISQSLWATGIAPAENFAQVMEFACGRDHIVGRRPHVGSSELPETYAENIIGLGR
jgi:hypothetical protein